MRLALRAAIPTAIAAAACLVIAAPAAAQSSVITYQGQIKDGAAPANGPYDLRFTVFTAPTGGIQISDPNTHNDVPVADGVFTVPLSITSSVFNAFNPAWLQIEVRPGDSTGAYQTLSPRQYMAPAPFSLNTRGIMVHHLTGFVGIGRDVRVTDREVFGLYRPGDGFGGMYIRTDTDGAPFYGYSENGAVSAYHYWNGINDTWRLNVNGDRIIVNTQGNVGIATATPAERLDVNGNARAAGFLYNSDQTRTLSIPGAAFNWTAASSPPTESPSSGLQFPDSVATATLHAAVNLPNLATITAVEFFVFDNSAGSFNVSLVTRPHGQFGSSPIISANSGNSVGMQTLAPAVVHVVNNNTNSYFLRVHTTDWINPMGLFSARITYTVNRPD
jgi:hypothetical protein